VREEARQRGLRALDATCPLVAKVHVEALRCARDGFDIALVGHRGHVEVEGTLGHAPERMHLIETIDDAEAFEVSDPKRVAALTQTTLSVDDTRAITEVLRKRFPDIVVPAKDDICYATQNRQDAVKAIAREAEVILVIGASNSSNSIRLVEVAEKAGCRAYLISDAGEISPDWFDSVVCVGVTSGASAPEHLVREVVASLERLGAKQIETLDVAEEAVSFRLPLELMDQVPS
jgi:4-hydroxy-3-methylbut-2-enyl diphosphate reductase